MKILFATSEAIPLIKTGGLADVSGALPRALRDLHHDVRLILPGYPRALERAAPLRTVATLDGLEPPTRLLRGRLPESDVPVYLVDCPMLFDRGGGPYVDRDGEEWSDNDERFALFCRAIVRLATGDAGIPWRPAVVHCNDWQTGLVPALLQGVTPRPGTLFTIHNLAYQGLFPKASFKRLGLPEALWSPDGLEFWEQLSFIKGGIAFADRLNTVSPTYAREICTEAFGHGLDGLLRHRFRDLCGILNGADYAAWNPATDPLIAHRYGPDRIGTRARNKAALQREFGLPLAANTALVAHIGRFAWQKGTDLIADALATLDDEPLQVVILGTGDHTYERQLKALARAHPTRIGVRIGYEEAAAHRIEAGADLFLMPSRYEPCGLNQIYSLRYGCVPVVRRTGGLADTVIDATRHTLRSGVATGVLFDEASAWGLVEALHRALALYADRSKWRHLQRTGMLQDFGWDDSARAYTQLYREIAAG